jgi:hypothetical protein
MIKRPAPAAPFGLYLLLGLTPDRTNPQISISKDTFGVLILEDDSDRLCIASIRSQVAKLPCLVPRIVQPFLQGLNHFTLFGGLLSQAPQLSHRPCRG